VAVSPDGKLLAAQTTEVETDPSTVEVRNAGSGEVVYRHAVRYGDGGLSFSPDGRELAALRCFPIRPIPDRSRCDPASVIDVWDAQSGRELFSPRVDGNATSIEFSPDGRLLGAGTEDGRVVLWDARGGNPVGSPIRVATNRIATISFSPDNRLLVASSTDQTVILVDLESRKRIGASFPIDESSVPVARFAPNGDVVIDYLPNTAQWPADLRTWVRFGCPVAGRDLTRAEWNDLLPNRPRRVCP
jgi:WD40 repeat protein